MSDLQGAHIHISGIVQGVGFRPFVYSLAMRLKLNGWVRNTSAGVDIEVDGEKQVLEAFIAALREEAPPLASIDALTVSFQDANGFDSFKIVHSEPVKGAFQPISPDVSLCPDCLRELFDPADRRYRYPFINCTNCGPRFTIILDIPYDRPQTTMAPFVMCPDCAREYEDPLDRRFHAQPVACSRCGPEVWLEEAQGAGSQTSGSALTDGGVAPIARGEQAIQAARRMLAEGKILGVKGLGGFHLACDATKPDAVVALRQRKMRVDKPFALMMPDIETIAQHCVLDVSEREMLESSPRPIVLLQRKPDSPIALACAPGQHTLGVMLPYTPLHYLLLEKAPGFPAALVMTSGNLSEEPIAIANQEARERLSSLADAFLMHDRDIHIRCDDSVVRVYESGSRGESTDHAAGATRGPSVYPLRRSRGYAPFPVRLPFEAPPLLATGPELKNTFCITNGPYAFLSHHIGDMENLETLRSFRQGVEHFERLFRVTPQGIAYDLHPDYLATRYALERSEKDGLPAIAVQHHHAHIAACMAEHGLDGSQKVIGLACDGTGYGQDGAIWGGEVLLADYEGFQRALHLEYFPLPGGDAAIKRPARTALALLWSSGLEWDGRLAPVSALNDRERATLLTQLERKINTPLTSSMGRLFDAAASLAGVRQAVNYEAQAAVEFEAMLDPHEQGAYPFEIAESTIHAGGAMKQLVQDVLAGVSAPVISARFHQGLASVFRLAVDRLSAGTGIRDVALSGGVWQNITLLRRTLSLLKEIGYNVYIHRQVPTNDGGLSLGQAVVAAAQIRA